MSFAWFLFWKYKFFYLIIAASHESSTTISAKPQIRNIRAESTKFVPTAVKIHRNPNKPTGGARPRVKPSSTTTLSGNLQQQQTQQQNAGDLQRRQQQQRQNQEPTKDDIYAKFMQEMDGFL